MSVTKNFNDVQEFIDHFDREGVVRGETPHDLKERCLRLCRDYLSGDWMKQTVDSITSSRLSGSMTNQLYHCSIAQPRADSNVPQEVVIRFYGGKHFNNSGNEGNDRLNDVVIDLMVSENGLGPKLYGVFEDGQIHHFYKHRQFRTNEQNNPVLVERLFRTLARIHAMDVPIQKSPNWFFKYFDDKRRRISAKDSFDARLREYNCHSLIDNNLEAETNWLLKIISDMPVVFIHHDFRGSNVLVTEPDDQILVVDFEYSAYGFRGYDFATVISQWGRNVNDIMNSEKNCQTYPSDDKIRQLLRNYINESEVVFGNSWSQSETNSMQHLLRETKIFTLAVYLFEIHYHLAVMEEDGEIPIGEKIWMQLGDHWFDDYFYVKNKFIKQGLFD